MQKFLLTTLFAALAVAFMPSASQALGHRHRGGCNSGCETSCCSSGCGHHGYASGCSSCGYSNYSSCGYTGCSTCGAYPMYSTGCSSCGSYPMYTTGYGTGCSSCGSYPAYYTGAMNYGYYPSGCSSCGPAVYYPAQGAPMMMPGQGSPTPYRTPEALPTPKTTTEAAGSEAR